MITENDLDGCYQCGDNVPVDQLLEGHQPDLLLCPSCRAWELDGTLPTTLASARHALEQTDPSLAGARTIDIAECRTIAALEGRVHDLELA